MSSRIIVKNLPQYVDENRMKVHFSQKGEITDVKIVRDKQTNKSRQFGFVGYKSESEAKAAIRYFNNSYMDTRKLEVSLARPKGDTALPQPWSRHSEGSSAHKRKIDAKAAEEERLNPSKKQKLDNEDDEKKEDGFEKQYYMKLVKGTKGKIWADDNILPEVKTVQKSTMKDGTKVKEEKMYVASKKTGGENIFYERKRIVFESDEEMASDEEEYQTIPNLDPTDDQKDEKTDNIALDPSISDLDYFKMKKTAKTSFSDDEEEEDGEEDIEDYSEDEISAPDSKKSSEKPESSEKPDETPENPEKNKENEKTKEKNSKTEEKSEKNQEKNKEKQEKPEKKQDLFEIAEKKLGTAEDDSEEENIGESGRIFVRNLPFSTTEEELIKLFSKFGELSEVHLPVHPETKLGKGFAFVLFQNPSDAVKAFDKLDNSIFQGRLMHLLPAKAANIHIPAPDPSAPSFNSDSKSSFKKLKDEKQKQHASNDVNWNTIFLRQDTVANAIAEQLKVSKSDLFNPEADNMAVRMALAEAQIIQDTKTELEQEGVDLNVLQYQNVSSQPRSNRVILVKNLPFNTTYNDLFDLFSKFGDLARIVLPTTKAIALVEFISSNDAKSAFKGLAYKRFKHVPLYLEWTPEAIFKKEAELDNKPEKVETSSIKEKIETEEIKSSESSTLYVKNLNFKTTEEALRSLCLQHVPESSIRAVTIAKSKKGNKVLSLGFGFIEFSDKAAAVKALKTIQGGELDGHKLMLKFSSSNDKNKGKPTKRKQAVKPSAKATSAKLLVKNLAFEVQKQDLRKLFGPFGQVKVVRIPKKFDGKSRGYGFVEFTTKQEAKNAYEKLTHAHLYGRHLVIEYAKEENSSLESIANKVKENLSKY